MKYSVLMVCALIYSSCCMHHERFGNKTLEPNPAVFQLKLAGVHVTNEERSALNVVKPILINASDNDYFLTQFWASLRDGEIKELSWNEAKKMILSGAIVEIMQSHSREVVMTAKNGEVFSLFSPNLDDVFAIIDQVDPKGVFILVYVE
ncbi:MAG: hypothetical protein JJU05_03645 [Verrucomicrobia bacterium]|nr:hypothetical protein [Verrucomicrobiota bacterium]MCH8526500.1 hypothetical protein [Kiritimatiellia bacterium]